MCKDCEDQNIKALSDINLTPTSQIKKEEEKSMDNKRHTKAVITDDLNNKGEFVFTAKAVDNAGGPKAMYNMMNKLDPESEKPN